VGAAETLHQITIPLSSLLTRCRGVPLLLKSREQTLQLVCIFIKECYCLLNTHINDPVLRAVGIGTTHVEAAPISHRLNDPDVVSAVEMLQQITEALVM
jgi:hypothetical protein